MISLVSPDIERQLLSLLLTTRSAPSIASSIGLRDTDFGYDSHRIIYSAIESIIESGGQADESTVKAHLESSSMLDVIGEDVLDAVITESCDPSMTSDYVRVLKDRRLRRDVSDAAESILVELRTTPETSQMLERVQSHLFRATDSYMNVAYNGVRAIDMRKHYWQSVMDTERIRFGFSTLNGVNRGRARGSLTIIAGYSSTGKSTFATTESMYAARDGHKVGLFSLEMTEEEIVSRMLKQITGIDSRRIDMGDLSERERECIDTAFREIESMDFTVYSDPTLSPSDIKNIQMRERYDLVMVDYLQRFDFSDWIEVGRISKSFKNLALTTNSCVDLLSQITPPQSMPGSNPMPRASMQNLFGGRMTTNEANNILIIDAYREQSESGAWNKTGRGALYVAKFRNGRAEFDVDMQFNGDYLTWEEV